MGISIKPGADIPPDAVQDLFIRNRWSDWLSKDDIQWYLSHAYYAVSAWDDSNLAGLAVLVGDGRVYLELENLLVDEKYRGKGIANALMTDIMRAVNRAKPYAVKIEVFQKETEAFYWKFGFIPNKETWLLELKTGSNSLTPKTRKKLSDTK